MGTDPYSPPIRLGLDAVRRVCDSLGRPQLTTPTVLIAGTNGKGSTATTLEAIGCAAGLRVGLFHSPSLGDEHEQIRLGGMALEAEAFAALCLEVRDTAKDIDQDLTPFEVHTVASYLAFSRSGLDLAIVEVGLGGARDATNIAEPVASVLTTVDFDHQQYLGHTLASIAKEKAGIFRPRRPAILGFIRGPAQRVARQEATVRGARVVAAQCHIRELRELPDASLYLRTERATYRLELALRGEHQWRNAALAVLAAETLRGRFPQLDEASILTGVKEVNLPGRLEWVSRNERQFLLDAAHNPAAARALATYLESLDERPDLLFGAFSDKDAAGMLEILRPQVGRLLLTPIESPRTWLPSTVASSFGGEMVVAPGEGLALARPSVPLVISGSLRLVGDVRRILLEPATSHAA